MHNVHSKTRPSVVPPDRPHPTRQHGQPRQHLSPRGQSEPRLQLQPHPNPKLEKTIPPFSFGPKVLVHQRQPLKKAALAELSRLVVVEIESQFEASQSYSDGKTKSEVTDVNKVASKGYFSGIKYVTKNESSGRIRVEAQLTQKSASETVSNLQQDLSVDFLNEKKRRLRKLAQKAIFLRALSVVLGSGFDSTQTFAEGRRAEIMQLLAQTRVSLELKPSAATMEIDGRSFSSGESFFLRPGKHTWRVEASNAYEPKRGDLLATKGERKNVSIELVPRAQSGWAAVMVRGPRKVLKAELGRYGYKVVKEANLKLRLNSNVEEVSVSGYTKYTIRARLEALRGESVAHVVKATTSFSTKTGTTKGKTEAQIEKLTIQFVERFLSRTRRRLLYPLRRGFCPTPLNSQLTTRPRSLYETHPSHVFHHACFSRNKCSCSDR